MAKYIDKNKAYRIVLHYGSYAASSKIADMESIELVRCGECKFNYANMIHDPLDDADYTDITCTYWMSDGVHPKDYCSKGARMDGERRES